MNKRFEELYKFDENLYKEGSPIIVSAATLLKDTETESIVAQFKFQSISEFSIKALKILLKAYDISGEELTKIEEYQYLDLDVKNGEYFGSRKAIMIPDKVTRSIKIDKVLVVFENGNSCEIVGEELFSLKKPQKLSSVLDDDLAQQYQLDVSNTGVYVPEDIQNLWYCICGKLNVTNVCTACGSHKENLFNAYNLDTLREHLDLRIEEERIEQLKQQERYQDDIYLEAIGLMESNQLAEAEQAIQKFETVLEWKDSREKILDCKSKIAQLELEAKNKAKKIKKVAIITIAIITFVIAISFAIVKYYIPYNRYNRANEALKNEQYDNAISMFDGLGTYKDSKKLLKEAKYRKAVDFMDEEKYEEAYFLLAEIRDHQEAKELLKKFIERPKQVTVIYSSGEKEVTYYTYDTKGNCVEERGIDEEGDEYKKIYSYNEYGLCVKESYGERTVECYYDNEQKCTRKEVVSPGYAREIYEYSYDSYGNVVRETMTKLFDEEKYPDGLKEVIDYEYDSLNNCTKMTEVQIMSGDRTVYEYSYDSYERCVKEVEIKTIAVSGLSFRTTQEYSYDEKGKLKHESYDSEMSGSQYTTEYFYDDRGQCIKEEFKSRYGKPSVTKYEYKDYQGFYITE